MVEDSSQTVGKPIWRLVWPYSRKLCSTLWAGQEVVFSILNLLGVFGSIFLPKLADMPKPLNSTWSLLIVFLLFELFLGGLLVYRDMYQKVVSTEAEVRRLHDAEAHLDVGLKTPQGVAKGHKLSITAVPPGPDFQQLGKKLCDKANQHYVDALEKEVMERRMPFRGGAGGATYVLKRELYDQDVHGYVTQAIAYVQELRARKLAMNCLHPIPVVVRNPGNSLASSVTVEIALPTSIELATQDQIDWFQKCGYDPTKPRAPHATRDLRLGGSGAYNEHFESEYDPEPPSQKDTRGPRFVDRPAGKVALYILSSIAAGQTIDNLEPIYAVFDQIADDSELELGIEIFSGSTPPQRSSVHLFVDVTKA